MTDGILNCGTELGTLTVDGTQLVGGDPRWCAFDLSIFSDTQNQRGDDDLIPGVDEVLANEHRFAPTTYMIPFAVTGHVNAAGGYLGRDGNEHRRALAAVSAARTLLVGDDRTVIWDFTEETWTGTGHILDLDRAGWGDGIWDGFVEFLLLRPWEIT